jgi:hypothetical protein
VSQTKYVDYVGRGFWAYDVILNVFLKHLIDAAQVSDEAGSEWVSSATMDWLSVASIPDIGLSLRGPWREAQRRSFVAMTEAACAKLAERTSISATEITSWPLLEDMRIFPRGATEVPTAPIVELAHAVVALVSGTLPEAPTGTAWFYTDAGRETIGMHKAHYNP